MAKFKQTRQRASFRVRLSFVATQHSLASFSGALELFGAFSASNKHQNLPRLRLAILRLHTGGLFDCICKNDSNRHVVCHLMQ